MKQWGVFMLACLTEIVAFSASEVSAAGFTAKLPNGISVELIGLRNYRIRDLEKLKDRDYPWWKPNGTLLSEPPDTGWGRTSSIWNFRLGPTNIGLHSVMFHCKLGTRLKPR